MKVILEIVLKSLKSARYAMKQLVDKKLVRKYYYSTIDNLIKEIESDFDMKL